jgi:hypothetical protein
MRLGSCMLILAAGRRPGQTTKVTVAGTNVAEEAAINYSDQQSHVNEHTELSPESSYISSSSKNCLPQPRGNST